MARKKYLIGVDSGTQGTKVIICDEYGNIVSQGSAVHEPIFQLQPGWQEQHPEDNWAKLCQASRQALDGLDAPKTDIVAIGLTGQRGTATLVDRSGQALRPFITWLDTRSLGVGSWLRENEPEIVEKAYKLTSVQGWLTRLLTGEFKDCVSYPPVGPLMVNVLLNWPDDSFSFEAYGMPREKLMDIVPPGTIYGCVTREAAEATGLPEGVPVVAGAGDKQCEVLGGGAVGRGQAYVTYGTLSSALTIAYDRPIISNCGAYYTLGAAVPGAWSPETSVRGHWMVTWFRDEFCRDLIAKAQECGLPPEELLNREAEQVPPGSEGLVVFPYWDARPSKSEAKGLILGFYNGLHRRPHVFRAILEGIAYGLREGIEHFAADSGVPITSVTVGGGGSKSDIGMQASADIFGVPCRRPHTAETSGLGAAIEAAVGIGLYGSYDEAVKHMTRAEAVFEPNPKNQELYDAIYQRVFSKIYPSLEQVFVSLNEIAQHTLIRMPD